MVSKAISWTGIGVMALLTGATTTWADSGEDLARRMHVSGIRSPIAIEARNDLQDVFTDAQDRALREFGDCRLSMFFEVQLKTRFAGPEVAGYEAYLDCEDAPAVGIGLYYDLEGQYMAPLPYGT